MKTVLSRIAILLFVLMACGANAFPQGLTTSQKEALQRRVKDKVDEFQFYLGQLADKESTSSEVKNSAYRLSLKLFIGEGENYSIYDFELGRDVQKSAVRMEVSSKYRSTKSRILMKRYLDNLRNNTAYSQIEITDADAYAVRVSNICPVDDHYECIAVFQQKYIGFRDGSIAYSDLTTKKVKVYIQKISIPKADGSTEDIWNALLGDIYVIETRAI